MKLMDYTILVAKLGSCLPGDIGLCLRRVCFGAKDRLALEILFQMLNEEQYCTVVKQIRSQLETDAYPTAKSFRLPEYRQSDPFIDCCFPTVYLFRALASTLTIE